MTGCDFNPAITSAVALTRLDTALDRAGSWARHGSRRSPFQSSWSARNWLGFIDAAECVRAASEND
jgi:hypothetical protein